MIRTHKIRLNPTPDQWASLIKAAGTARYAYNWAVAQWQAAIEQKPTPADLQAQFKAAQPDWIREVPPSAPEGALQDFAAALQNYYEGRSNAPEFRSRNRGDFRFRLDADQFHVAGNWLRVATLGLVNMTESLRFAGRVLNATVYCEDEVWYVAIAVDIPDVPEAQGKRANKQYKLPSLTDSTVLKKQRTLRKYLIRLARLQRTFSRKQKGSKNQEKLRDKIASLNQRVCVMRDDFFHSFGAMAAHWMNAELADSDHTTGSVKNQDHLSLSTVMPVAPPDANLPEKADSLAQATWKATARFFSSGKACPQCGYQLKKRAKGQQKSACPNCGFVFERGASAALNFLNKGLRFTREESSSGSGYDGRKSAPSDGEHPEDDRHRSQER